MAQDCLSALPPGTSFLSAFVHLHGYGQPSPISPLATPNVWMVSPTKFQKVAKHSTENISLLRFHPVGSPAYIWATATSVSDDLDDVSTPLPPPEPPPSSPDNPYCFVPDKYMPWADTVFNPIEFDKLPEHRSFDIEIEIEEGKSPPFGPIYRLTPAERDAVAEYVTSNLKCGHIQHSTSSAGAPILFTRKKTGDIQLCVDFRGLNAITRKNRYPIPLANDLFDRVQGCKIFSIIDLKSAYSHLCIREGDEWKMAFRTHLGLFEHLIVPYGLTNAPAAFQSFIQDVLHDHLDIFCVLYLDDILIF